MAPCEREVKLHRALVDFVVTRERPHQRWTEKIIGWKQFEPLPPNLCRVVENAYGMPFTFKGGCIEHNYWTERDADMAAILDFPLGEGLDYVALLRADLIRDQVFWELPVNSLKDLYDRVKLWQIDEAHTEKEAILILVRDLKRLCEMENNGEKK